MVENKMLLVFDFDHTVVSEDSIIGIIEELSLPEVPKEVMDKWDVEGDWNACCEALFSWIHTLGITESAIKNTILSLDFTDGMEELMNYLQQNCYDVVILSDANALFIEWFFCNRKLNVKKIYSNPAKFDEEGKLILHQFHHQTTCNQCPVNLCKGAVIKDHIESMRKAGTLYSTVCYTGDGENDFCPSLRLTENDYVFPRATFPLEQMLKSKMSEVKAQVVPWKSATVIKQKLQSLATQ